MKRHLRSIPALACAAACLAASVPMRASDVLAQLRLTESAAEEQVLRAVWGGSPAAGAATAAAFKALSPEARAAVVTAAGEYVRRYVGSDAFRRAYAAERERRRPQPPAAAKPWKEQQAEQQAQFEKSVTEMKANMATATPEVRRIMQQTIDTMIAQRAALEADADLQKRMAEAVELGAKHQQEAHARQLAQFETDYPADPNALVARRLRELIALVDSVPERADLIERGGRLRFADPALERKPALWKQCYRAGRPALAAARTFAAQWLNEID